MTDPDPREIYRHNDEHETVPATLVVEHYPDEVTTPIVVEIQSEHVESEPGAQVELSRPAALALLDALAEALGHAHAEPDHLALDRAQRAELDAYTARPDYLDRVESVDELAKIIQTGTEIEARGSAYGNIADDARRIIRRRLNL